MDLMNDNVWRVKVGLAEMLKGGVIMDVTTPEPVSYTHLTLPTIYSV